MSGMGKVHISTANLEFCWFLIKYQYIFKYCSFKKNSSAKNVHIFTTDHEKSLILLTNHGFNYVQICIEKN